MSTTEEVSRPKLLSTRERLLAEIDAAIFELTSTNGTNMTDYSEIYYDSDYQTEEDELVKFEGAVPTPNRTLASSSSSSEQQLSSAQRELLEKLERSFGQYVREKSEERERAFNAWMARVDSAGSSSLLEDITEPELDREDDQVRKIEEEVLDVDLKLRPLKARFQEFDKAISTSDFLYLCRHSFIM